MKRTIYVVDDQYPLLDMTVLGLRCMGRDWEVTGFAEPFAALEAVKASEPDAVLSDHMMPGIEGSKLLEQVRIISPNTIRLIMSGYVAMDKLTLITSAHQYIAKPFEPSKLRDLIQRSFAAQDRIINQGLQQVVTSIRSIPSLPQAHHSLLQELEDSRNASTTIARLIGDDPGLSVKVLQLANSALFGPGYTVANLIDAVNCLGTEMLSSIVLSQSVFRHYEALKSGELDLPKVWAHCWETACVAQRICREKRLPHRTGEEAFLAGLLHEVGRFLLFDNFPDQFKIACEMAHHSNTSLAATLREVLQITPSQMSAYVLELWGMPAAVIKSISSLDNPEKDQIPGFSITSALYVADRLAAHKFPADSFPIEDWKTSYLQSTGCADDIPVWEEQSMNPAEGGRCKSAA
jgi:HD-like signal output (HDOD) protein